MWQCTSWHKLGDMNQPFCNNTPYQETPVNKFNSSAVHSSSHIFFSNVISGEGNLSSGSSTNIHSSESSKRARISDIEQDRDHAIDESIQLWKEHNEAFTYVDEMTA